MPHVLLDLRRFERHNVQPHRHPLAQLAQVFAPQQLAQLHLPGQNHLQQLPLGSLEIHQQADFFEQLGGHLVGFVD